MICFMCLGNEGAPFNTRVYNHSRPGDLSNHFKRKHLANIVEGLALGCGLCRMSLEHKMHSQNHAARIHGTVS